MSFRKSITKNYNFWHLVLINYFVFISCYVFNIVVDFVTYSWVRCHDWHLLSVLFTNQEQNAWRYVDCPIIQPMGTKLLPGDIIAPLYNFYPCRLWGKPKEVNVGLHVGSDDLNLKKSRSRLRVQGFENLLTYDSMTFLIVCRNLSLGLATKARACKVAGQEWAQESHFMIPGV